MMSHVFEKRLAEIEKKLLLHDSSLRDLYNRIRPLLLPPPEKPMPTAITMGRWHPAIRKRMARGSTALFI